jgi:predicted kinase
MKGEKSFARCLFETLLEIDKLHVPSTLTKGYRNKITYSIPLPQPLSPLAHDYVNKVCQVVASFPSASELFREVMVKATRQGHVCVRITVQTTKEAWKDDFVTYMCKNCPQLECLCYNETNTKARPTKDHPIHVLYGKPFVLETTLNNLEYQISPDTFCEVNHEVERLQYNQAKEWIVQYHDAASRECNHNADMTQLLVSGRDVSSFGLGFGSLVDKNGISIFNRVLAVQHCPLVHKDAVANFSRHAHLLDASVHHKSKQEMVQVLKHNANGTDSTIMGVMTGGRKGLDPSYLDFLLQSEQVVAIIYNSCSTKSLVRDMEGLMQAFHVKDFRSYNFFPGTSYTASLTYLIRKRKTTLVIPVGPAGVGKSTFAAKLRRGGMDISWWQRDEVFKQLREQGFGLNKTKQLVHQDLLSFLRNTNGIVYLDSTNGNNEARQLYIKQSSADRIIYVSFQPTATGETVLEALLENTRNRLGPNDANHPSFPDTVEEQRKKHLNILKGISYPTVAEMSSIESIVPCDPFEAADTLPFQVFLEISTSPSIKEAVLTELRIT